MISYYSYLTYVVILYYKLLINKKIDEIERNKFLSIN